MRKLHIFINDISCSGGTERVASFLANNLVKHNFDLTIVSLFGEKGSNYYVLDHNVKVKYIGSSSFAKVLKFIRQNPCDILISISMGRLSFKIAMLNAVFNFPLKLVLSEHVAYESSPFWVRMLKLVSYQFCDTLILLTQHDYNVLYRKVRAKTFVIRNASTFDSGSVDMLKDKQKIVLAVGRLTYQKSFDRLLQIWAAIKNTNGWTLKIVGDGEEK
ncbi:TPA: glycosyltransferase, partial [Citrobacter werkmanii]